MVVQMMLLMLMLTMLMMRTPMMMRMWRKSWAWLKGRLPCFALPAQPVKLVPATEVRKCCCSTARSLNSLPMIVTMMTNHWSWRWFWGSNKVPTAGPLHCLVTKLVSDCGGDNDDNSEGDCFHLTDSIHVQSFLKCCKFTLRLSALVLQGWGGTLWHCQPP